MSVSLSLTQFVLSDNLIVVSQKLLSWYSGATGSRQSSQPGDIESLQQSHHRAAYISIANAEVENLECRVSIYFLQDVFLFHDNFRIFNFRQNESVRRASSRLWRVSGSRGVGLNV